VAGNSLIGIGGRLSEPLVISYKDLKPNKEAGPLELLVSFIRIIYVIVRRIKTLQISNL